MSTLSSSVPVWVLLFACSLQAQSERPPEAVARVPALESFHTVVREIWHEAWPNKDTALLRKLQPEVEKGIAQVSAAPLPRILHEKKSAWEQNVRKLQEIGANFKAAAAGTDDAALLAAAEKLHSQFEAMVRVIRPPLREIDAFHSALYMLYHHYLPSFQIDKIKASAAEMKDRMADLNRAKLPARLEAKQPEFVSARAELSKAVDEFGAVMAGAADRKQIEAAVEKVHSAYESLNSVFE